FRAIANNLRKTAVRPEIRRGAPHEGLPDYPSATGQLPGLVNYSAGVINLDPIIAALQRFHHLHIDCLFFNKFNLTWPVAATQRASDIFLKEGVPPNLRVHGHIQPTDYPVVDAEEVRRIAYSLMRPELAAQFEKTKEMDLAFTRPGVCRFRGNIYMQRGSI